MASGTGHLAFFYGTLKRGFRNNDLVRDPAKGSAVCRGNGQTTLRYPLVVATEYNSPFLLKAPGQGHEVRGEVYEVDDTMLAFLDKFEGHPDFYVRDEVSVQLTEDENGKTLDPPQSLQCSTYFLCEVKEDFMQLTMLKEFTGTDEDGLPYPIRNHRKVPLKKLVFPDRC